MRLKLALPILFAALLVMGCGNKHGDIERKEFVTKSTLPAKVQRAFDRDFPGASIRKVKRETFDDKTIKYEIEYFQSGVKQKIVYEEDGEQAERQPEKRR